MRTSLTTAVISLNVSGLPSSASDVHFSCHLWLKLRQWREKHQAAQAFEHTGNAFMFHHRTTVIQQVPHYGVVSMPGGTDDMRSA